MLRIRLAAIRPTLLMSRLQRLHQSAVKARHVHNLMIGSDVALDQAVSDLPCFFVGHRGNSLESLPPQWPYIRYQKGARRNERPREDRPKWGIGRKEGINTAQLNNRA